MRLNSLIIVSAGIVLSGCISHNYSDKFYTYILQNRYNVHDNNSESEGKIELFSHNYRNYDLRFEIFENSVNSNGTTPNGYGKYIYSEPFDLAITVEAYSTNWIKNGKIDTGRENDIDLNKIIFNKIILHTKNKSIDIHDKIILNREDKKEYPSGRRYSTKKIFDDDDILLFKNYGIIDLAKQRETLGYFVDTASLFLENIDINYKNDKYYIIELDITLEKDDGTSENKIIKAKFIRKTRTTAKQRALLGNYF